MGFCGRWLKCFVLLWRERRGGKKKEEERGKKELTTYPAIRVVANALLDRVGGLAQVRSEERDFERRDWWTEAEAEAEGVVGCRALWWRLWMYGTALGVAAVGEKYNPRMAEQEGEERCRVLLEVDWVRTFVTESELFGCAGTFSWTAKTKSIGSGAGDIIRP